MVPLRATRIHHRPRNLREDWRDLGRGHRLAGGGPTCPDAQHRNARALRSWGQLQKQKRRPLKSIADGGVPAPGGMAKIPVWISLNGLGEGSTAHRQTSAERAKDPAMKTVDRLMDPSAPPAENAVQRRLIKAEAREQRVDRTRAHDDGG